MNRLSDPPRGFSPGWSISLAGHVVAILAFLWLAPRHPRPQAEPMSISVDLMEVSESPPPGLPATQANAGTPEPIVAPLAQQPSAPPVDETEAVPSTPNTSDLLSETQLAGAVGVDEAGEGGGGGAGAGGCNMALILQRALQRDPMVHRAVADAGRLGKAVLLWNGDWVRSGNQDGKGLSGIRQAILWELGFAPEACRNKSVEGVVLLSLNDGTRFAIGSDAWRWSDLLGLRERAASQ